MRNLFLLFILLNYFKANSQCGAISIPTGTIATPYIKQSNLQITTFDSNTLTTSPPTQIVIFDAHPSNGYVLLNPGFIAAPTATGAFIAQALDGCGTSIPSKMSSSISGDLKNELVSIYPNPTKDVLNIKINIGYINNIIVTTVDGKELLEKKINNLKECNIDVINFSNGTYFIFIQSKNGDIFKQTFIKN